MVQKCSNEKVFEVFADEPTRIHYIKEISKKINLAHTSVKKHLEKLKKDELILKKKGDIFEGHISNRDNEDFLFYKRISNLKKIKESGLLEYLINKFYPEAIVLYGSYLKGEDIESSDVDLLIISKSKNKADVSKFEKRLKRNIHIMYERGLDKLPDALKKDVINGLVLYGYLK